MSEARGRETGEAPIAAVGAVNVRLRQRLARARERAALSWEEWLEAIRPEVVGILVGIAHNRRAPLQERRAAERALARCGYGNVVET